MKSINILIGWERCGHSQDQKAGILNANLNIISCDLEEDDPFLEADMCFEVID